MQSKMAIFPNEDGFSVLIWGKGREGSMRVRQFDNRTTMIALLEALRLVTPTQAKELEDFPFLESCPLYTTEVDQSSLAAHGFRNALPS